MARSRSAQEGGTVTGSANPARFSAWHAGKLGEEELAEALRCKVDDVRLLLASAGFRLDAAANVDRSQAGLGPRHRVGVAVAHSVHQHAGVPLATAADVISGSWRICDSILPTLDFFPAAAGAVRAARSPNEERDPFALFTSFASGAMAIPAIDEFIDIADGRHIIWRKPRRSAYRLACDIDRLAGALKAEGTPALQEEYLEALSRLREPADHSDELIGTILSGRFRPAPETCSRHEFAMRRAPGLSASPARFAECYAHKVSVNVSLAARSMKRRILGLTVENPYEPKPGGDER